MYYVGFKGLANNTQMGLRVTCSTIEPRGLSIFYELFAAICMETVFIDRHFINSAHYHSGH